MIVIDVAEYCSDCMDFNPDVERPMQAFDLNKWIVISDTVIRCRDRNRCANIEQWLRKRVDEHRRVK